MSVAPPAVPFIRALSYGSSGHDVIAVKRAISRYGKMQWGDFTPLWGQFAIDACKAVQRAKGLKQTGTYNFATHEALRKSHRAGSRTEWAFDGYSIKIMLEEDITPHDRVVAKTMDVITQSIVHRDAISYSQIRPWDITPYPHLPHYLDCSAYVTWCAHSGGWYQDPNNSPASMVKWGKTGFTGSLYLHGTPIPSIKSAALCDLVFYGKPWLSGGAAHVTIVREIHNGIVYVGSMGSEHGPDNIQATYRAITGIRRYQLVKE